VVDLFWRFSSVPLVRVGQMLPVLIWPVLMLGGMTPATAKLSSNPAAPPAASQQDAAADWAAEPTDNVAPPKRQRARPKKHAQKRHKRVQKSEQQQQPESRQPNSSQQQSSDWVPSPTTDERLPFPVRPASPTEHRRITTAPPLASPVPPTQTAIGATADPSADRTPLTAGLLAGGGLVGAGIWRWRSRS
jgi:hypothetical protein